MTKDCPIAAMFARAREAAANDLRFAQRVQRDAYNDWQAAPSGPDWTAALEAYLRASDALRAAERRAGNLSSPQGFRCV